MFNPEKDTKYFELSIIKSIKFGLRKSENRLVYLMENNDVDFRIKKIKLTQNKIIAYENILTGIETANGLKGI